MEYLLWALKVWWQFCGMKHFDGWLCLGEPLVTMWEHTGKWQLFHICQTLSWKICIHSDILENLLHNVLGLSSFRNIWTKFDSGGIWRSSSSVHGHRSYHATCHLFISCSCIVCWSLHMSATKWVIVNCATGSFTVCQYQPFK